MKEKAKVVAIRLRRMDPRLFDPSARPLIDDAISLLEHFYKGGEDPAPSVDPKSLEYTLVTSMRFSESRGVNTRIQNILRMDNITTIGDLLRVDEKVLARSPNCGEVCMKEIRRVRAMFGAKASSRS